MNLVLQIIKLDQHRFVNLLNLNKKTGKLVCRNGFILNFDQTNKKYVKSLFYFSLLDGVLFSNKKGYWHYKDNIITTPQGIKFDVHSFDELIFSETFLYDIHFSDFDLNNKIVVQAGGFTGDTALYYAYRGAKVYSFEPNPESYNLALLNLKLNPKLKRKIVFKNWAIDKDGFVSFHIDVDASGGSSIYNKGGNVIRVKSRSIGSILQIFNIKNPYLLDLDIKGSEFKVINEEVLSRFKIIRIEYSIRAKNKNLDMIIKRLKQLGFNKIR
ncbi:MAG: FkbM family methyltransferase, partial [Minisyncoccia bacterium]